MRANIEKFGAAPPTGNSGWERSPKMFSARHRKAPARLEIAFAPELEASWPLQATQLSIAPAAGQGGGAWKTESDENIS